MLFLKIQNYWYKVENKDYNLLNKWHENLKDSLYEFMKLEEE